MLFFEERLDQRVLECLEIKNQKNPNLRNWKQITNKQKKLKNFIEIGIVGKYIELKDAYKSLVEAIIHSGINKNTKVNINWFDSSKSSKLKKI